MDLCIFLAEDNPVRATQIKLALRCFASLSDVDRVDFYTCSQAAVPGKMTAAQLCEIHFALISLDFPSAKEVGLRLYQANPACRLIYYGDGSAELLPLLPSRPVWYWDCRDREALNAIWKTQLRAIQDDRNFFWYSDRLRSVAVPYVAVLCAYSLKRSVYLHTAARDLGPLPKALDWLQERFPTEEYIRVHQSFLVRRKSIRILDRGARTLTLEDGYVVPVSKANYESISALFETKRQ